MCGLWVIPISTVPTAAERTGDFRDILGGPIPASLAPYNVNPCTGQQVFYNEIFDPTTDRSGPATGQYCRSPFSTINVIPTNLLSPAAQKLLAGLPLPNQTGTANAPFPNYNNYATSGTVPNNNTTYTIFQHRSTTAASTRISLPTTCARAGTIRSDPRC